MTTTIAPVAESSTGVISARRHAAPQQPIAVALLTGGQDGHYAFGLATALAARDVCLDLIGSEEVDCPGFHTAPNIRFLSLRARQRQDARPWRKLLRIATYYARLFRYAASSKAAVFHILWNNKFQFFDRTFLMLYYKLLGKKVALTAHNINAGKRDSKDTWVNRITLRAQYRLADHIFVHTETMKRELLDDFGVSAQAVTVIPYGINNAIPLTDITRTEARKRLGIPGGKKTVLFFGAIAPYKGLDLLVTAFQRVVATDPGYLLVIAGNPKKGSERYVEGIRRTIRDCLGPDQVIERIEYIPDDEAEAYFKAADVAVLPYVRIFQSGILFWALSFGLPVIAADIGCFREDVIDGRTGFLCKPCDPADLAATIEKYFASDLFQHLDARQQEIREYAAQRHSWETVAQMTRNVYMQLLDPEAHSSPRAKIQAEPSGRTQ